MPLISADSKGIQSSVPLVSGSYHVTSLALADSARDGAIQVGIGNAELLDANRGALIWTASLQSCFPVIFKFSNGDIGLYHGNHAIVDDMPCSADERTCSIGGFLRRADLEEIQLFEKGTNINSEKVQGFAQSVIVYCNKNGIQVPVMNIQTKDQHATYGALVCYKSPEDGKPVILVGASGGGNSLVKTLEDCSNQEDKINACVFIREDLQLQAAREQQITAKNQLHELREASKAAINLEQIEPIIKDEDASPCCVIQ